MMRGFTASLPGTNLELTGDYNQRLIYQAIRTDGPITRTALTERTGLAKPTVAGIVKRLIKSDLVSETGRVYGSRGQPAVHLETNPEGCYAIGLHVDESQLALVVVDALGNPIDRTAADLQSAPRSQIGPFFRQGFAELTRDIRRDRIIGLGIALSGRLMLDHDRPVEAEADGVAIDLLTLSDITQGVPVYIDSDLAAATAGESLFGLGATLQSYYYILMDARPVGGLVLHQTLYRGAHTGKRRFLFPGAELGWCRDAIAAERAARHDRRAAPDVDEGWLAMACDDLLPLLVSINCMLNPGGVLFGGSFPQGWMATLAARCNTLLCERAPQIPSHAGIQTARLAGDVALIGAASLPMRARLLPIEEALLKDREHV